MLSFPAPLHSAEEALQFNQAVASTLPFFLADLSGFCFTHGEDFGYFVKSLPLGDPDFCDEALNGCKWKPYELSIGKFLCRLFHCADVAANSSPSEIVFWVKHLLYPGRKLFRGYIENMKSVNKEAVHAQVSNKCGQ